MIDYCIKNNFIFSLIKNKEFNIYNVKIMSVQYLYLKMWNPPPTKFVSSYNILFLISNTKNNYISITNKLASQISE